MSEKSPIVHVESHIVTAWQGALPPPDALAKYESIVKGAAERLLTLAETEAKARIDFTARAHADDHAAAMKDIENYHKRIATGQYVGAAVALAFLCGAVVCAWLGQTAIGVAIAGATIVGIVNAIAAGGRKR